MNFELPIPTYVVVLLRRVMSKIGESRFLAVKPENIVGFCSIIRFACEFYYRELKEDIGFQPVAVNPPQPV